MNNYIIRNIKFKSKIIETPVPKYKYTSYRKTKNDQFTFIGKEYVSTKSLSSMQLTLFIERDLILIKNFCKKHKLFDFEVIVNPEQRENNFVLNLTISKFNLPSNIAFPIFQGSYILRWLESFGTINKFDNTFFLNNFEFAFNDHFKYLIRKIEQSINKYNFQKQMRNSEKIERRFYTSFQLCPKLRQRELKKIIKFSKKRGEHKHNMQ